MAGPIVGAYQSEDCDVVTSYEFTETARPAFLDTLTFLLDTGNPIDFESENARAVLTWACEAGRLDIMKLLAERGAPIKLVV
jgi:ankyrin repeat protein